MRQGVSWASLCIRIHSATTLIRLRDGRRLRCLLVRGRYVRELSLLLGVCRLVD